MQSMSEHLQDKHLLPYLLLHNKQEISYINVDNMPMMDQGMQMPMTGSVASPVIEPVQERVVQRTIMHEVPHVCPIRTRIINNHVYRHTYRPSYSCCSQDTVSNVQCGSCCQFR